MVMKTPESVLKKQATQAKIAAAKAEEAKVAAAKEVTDLAKFKKNAAEYEAAFEKEERDAINNRRMAKVQGGFYVPAQPKLCLVIRIREFALSRLRQRRSCSSSVSVNCTTPPLSS
jgi:large subunit ribosomal protein L7e